ncbi:carboxypeptidase-like regulatory domain-containing protein [Leeuwenhoekiella aequorea]|uniref:carboxypeptidase-like regulatory domain-containing protein n=1 Tax=Leeuwenhoekiella aequorea TaxID=283736 RepID=UPI0013E8ECEA|nr:carboxypeptidase-like regulatory domain-containing protein [Leeuwenhoekiella aequorea]
MKNLLPIIVFLVSNLCFSQIKAVIFDKKTKEKISYVNIWIENENIGTTSDENGEFLIDNSEGKNLVLSSLGYETMKINLKEVPSEIFLIPKSYELEEVIVSTKKDSKEKIIGAFQDSEIGFYYATEKNPEIKARLFDYDTSYLETPFLKSIKFRIFSDIKNAKFNIRFYSVGDNGQPDKPIFGKNIIGISKKGTKNLEIDLSDLNIYFPDNGLFVSYEWLIIEENEFNISIPTQDSNQIIEKTLYEPKVGLLPVTKNTNSWLYKNGKWEKVERFKGNSPKPYLDNYGILTIELTLTN